MSFSAYFRFLTLNSAGEIGTKNVALYGKISGFFFDITVFFKKNQFLPATLTKKNVVISKKNILISVFFPVLDRDITIKRWYHHKRSYHPTETRISLYYSLHKEFPKLKEWLAPGIPELLRTCRILVNAVYGAFADLPPAFSIGCPLGMRSKSLFFKAKSGSLDPKFLSSLIPDV